jgi:hypothetical protein
MIRAAVPRMRQGLVFSIYSTLAVWLLWDDAL